MAETEYYYKRIEEAISDFKGFTVTFKQSLDELGLESALSDISKDAEDLDKQYESLWLDCLEDYRKSHKLESLDDSQKEEVALQNKDALDILLNKLCEISKEIHPLLMAMKAYKDIHIAFLKLYSECDSFMKQYVDAAWDSEDESHTQLVLTPLELYYALSFLNESAVRVIFAHVSPGVLEDILKAYHAKDRDAFCYIIKTNEIHPSDQLLDYLNAGANEHSLSGIMSIFPSNPSERIRLLDAINDNPVGEVFIEDLLNETSSCVEDVTIPQVSNAFGECVVGLLGEYCLNATIPLRFRKKFMALYNQARETFTNIPKISELTSRESENEIGISLIEKLEIDYIMKKIHEAMEADSGNCITVIEMSNRVPSDIRNFNFPTRLAAGVSQNLYTNERIAVLTEIYHVFGGSFENMTCDDFVYLFGASNKVPSTYNLPYYWCGDEATLQAILRILYFRQPRPLRQMILHVSDKKNGAKDHDWATNKDKVAYADIEETIVSIVARVTGKILKKI